MSVPRLIAWEITRRCNYRCKHCRADAGDQSYAGELSTEECRLLLENIASFASPIIILTGGEPMSREDIYEIASYGTSLGLKMVMAPCGSLVTPKSARRLRESGIGRISLSIDGVTPETHDSFRGVPGALETVLRAAGVAREAGLPFQINSSIGAFNRQEIAGLLQLAIDLGAVAFHPFLLVPTGRARHLEDQSLSGRDYEETLEEIYRLSRAAPIDIKPTCAPQYYRILREQEAAAGRKVTVETHGREARARGCIGGKSFAFVSHTGRVQICGFLEESAGELRELEWDFRRIWESSELLTRIRSTPEYGEPCGSCAYVGVCGGCRARAAVQAGSPTAGDPDCNYVNLR